MASFADTRLERREFKYLIPRDLVARIRAATKTACCIDRYAGPDGTYVVRSLYLDTARYDLFWANEREQKDRFKARIRCYPGTGAPVFLEIKRRVLDTVIKTRGAVPPGAWTDVVASPTGLRLLAPGAASVPHVERFLALMHTYHLEPTLLVEYVREAYVSNHDQYARVTFDQRISCQVERRLRLDANPRAWRYIVPPGRTVMEPALLVLELKSGTRVPPWMSDLVRRFDLIRYSFSKYAHGIRNQLTLPELRVAARQA